MATFGEKLDTVMRRRGLSQKALAAKVDVAQSSISRWIGDSRTLPVGTLRRIADAVGVSATWLIDDVADWPPPEWSGAGAVRESPGDVRIPIRGVDATPPTTTARPAREPKPKRGP